jgi:ATP-dependent RNA helicase DeaD
MTVFTELGLSNELLDTITHLGFTTPTLIQEQSMPLIVQGKDIIGESATGSGKTLAFATGVIEHVNARQGLQALVLTPTRELAEQVKDSIRRLSKKLFVTTVYGGVSINPQIHSLTKADVVVATPGRLLDHLNRGTINLQKIKLLILDEADRMLEMGFIEDVEQIIKECPRERQTLFFSATISQQIKELAKKYMFHPVKISATKQVDPSKLEQVYYDVPRNMKLSLLAHLLEKEREGLVIVFCNTRRTVDFVVKNLKGNKIRAIAIHGGLSQNKRTQTIKTFNNGRVSVLICTDVAARGLHIDNVSHVYNYDIPKDAKDYVHRIGRTARAGEEGKAINFLCDYDYDNFSRIIESYRNFTITKQERPFLKKMHVSLERPQQRRHGRQQQRGRDTRRKRW